MSKSIITFAITVSIITIDCIHVVVHATSSTISSVSDIAISSSIMKLLLKTPHHTSPEGQVQEDLIVGRKAGSPPVGAVSLSNTPAGCRLPTCTRSPWALRLKEGILLTVILFKKWVYLPGVEFCWEFWRQNMCKVPEPKRLMRLPAKIHLNGRRHTSPPTLMVPLWLSTLTSRDHGNICQNACKRFAGICHVPCSQHYSLVVLDKEPEVLGLLV